ncbi:hypothetical protein CTI12_AA346450 [Artemisia annua]|uniref:SWIM-type domain-containing protein n=1 Tax=Artemisia annua TaxID=35608 RepID=A0A2U1MSM6_ARTAN|nr:hypothetical protein CTI12_AA346450 [Artemisia annua]
MSIGERCKHREENVTDGLRCGTCQAAEKLRNDKGEAARMDESGLDMSESGRIRRGCSDASGNGLTKVWQQEDVLSWQVGIKELKNDDDVQSFLTCGFETKWVVDLYVEHLDEDALDIRDNAESVQEDYESSDAYCSSEEEDFHDDEFFHEGEENVEIKNETTKDPFLNKLCSNSGHFRGFIDEPINAHTIEVIEDPDHVDAKYRAKSYVVYPRHDPTQDWDKMEPILGMRYENSEQLKLALANYGVHNGYQLWFMRNYWKQLLVYCGRDVLEGRCAGAATLKKRSEIRKKKDGEGCSKDGEGGSKVVQACSNAGEGSSKSPVKEPKKGRIKRKDVKSVDKKENVCGFRLFASWMSTENSFQIKSLKSKHKCSRNYNLGSLVTYKWIAHHFAKELIADPFIPLLKMKTDIRSKFHINRAKQRALFDYEGGLREHYGRLWEYRNAVLDTNPGIARKCEDTITPWVRKRLNYMIQHLLRYWEVIPSGFQELEVRNGNQSYGVNLTRKKCMCRMWELSGIPCIHALAAYQHMNRDPVEGVHDWYSQQKWFEAYQFTIRPVYGSNMWKRTRDPPLLPPLMRTMPGRPRKKRILAPDENNSQVTRRGRIMTCSNCQERGHNKASCKKEAVPPPPKPTRPSKSTARPDYASYASARGRGRGSRGQRGGGRGTRGGGRGQRGGGRGTRGGGRSQQRNKVMEEDEIRQNMEHEYMEMLLIQEEDRLAGEDRQQLEQEAFDEEALRLTLEAEARFAEEDLKREQDRKREHEEWEKNMGLHPSCYLSEEESYDQEPYNREVVDAPCGPSHPESDKGKGVATSSEPVKKGKKDQLMMHLSGSTTRTGEEIIEISSDTSESDYDARPWPWEEYFPKSLKQSSRGRCWWFLVSTPSGN